MISLIYDDLITPGPFPVRWVTPKRPPYPPAARRAPARPWRAWISRSISRLPRLDFPLRSALPARESFLHPGQLSVETGVGHEAADLGHEAAEEIGVDAILD